MRRRARPSSAGRLLALLAAGAAPWVAAAEGYPTADRVEFVLECLHANGGRQDYVYKCSCVIDDVARQLGYDDYVAASAVARYQTMGGERMGVFRDSESMQAMARRYRMLLAEAKKGCDVPR